MSAKAVQGTKRAKGTKAKGTEGTKRAARRQKRVAAASSVDVQEVESLRQEIERLQKRAPPRWNADPEEVRRSVLKLVLTLVEFIRQLLERQAIRRMEGGTLTDEQTEAIGTALMRLEETIRELCLQFDIPADQLNLDLGPIGKLV
jgi:hypothetical protein